MDKFKLEISMQFPFFKMNERVTYSRVKKPSGVAYILLVLISESKTKMDRLATVLENFGVPKSLHYIFADTIQTLLEQGILEKTTPYNKNEFDSYRIGLFRFTPKGKKIFAEESIPTGVNKEVSIPVFYDIAKNELSLKLDSELDPKPLTDCAISSEFMEQFESEKDVENYLNLQKGKRISIKKEEIITNVECVDSENWVGKYDCAINIQGDSLSVAFEDAVLQKFVEKYYTNEMINAVISYKNKFKFKSKYSEKIRLSHFESDKIVGVLIPKEIDDVLKQKSRLLLTKGNYISNNGFVLKSSDSLDGFDKSIEFIQVDMHDNIYAFIPGVFEFDNSVFGTIKIPLVIKLKITSDELKKIVLPYIASIGDYSEEHFKTLVDLTNITKDTDRAFAVLEGYLSQNIENNIVLLNEIKPYALSNASILNKYKELLQDNYYKYLASATEDNLDSVLKITASIPQFLNMSAKDVLATIFEKLNVKNSIEVYETLASKGFDKSLVALYVNPVPDALTTKNAEEKSLTDLINYDYTIEALKETTGIKDYKVYSFNEDSLNKDDFKTMYKHVFDLSKNIQVFRSANNELFKKYDGFMKIFTAINDDINILEAALKDPNNIKPELIEKKIANGDYQFVFVNLSAKLEIILKNQYGLEGRLSDMLSDARKNGMIDRNIVSDLHNFRENRNAYVHPEDRTTDFTANDLRRWNKEIFGLEEDKNESSSNS